MSIAALARGSLGIAAIAIAMVAGSHALADDGQAFFTKDVEPILRRRCFECHSHQSDGISGGLALDWKSGWAEGGGRGPAIIPGNVEGSLLIQAIRHTHAELHMPEQKLPAKEIAAIEEWVKRGAPDPRSAKPAVATTSGSDWWSLRPLARPPVPSGRGVNPIDAFVQARLHEKGLRPSPETDRRMLIRRLTFDLHGLPPTLEELAEFEADASPDAVERLVDRLLASPRYGERWARHWFDVIHFADTHGFEHDVFRPNAWRYRDYVIRSLNRDIPWSTFVREQLAADVFYPRATDLTAALGFLGAGPYDQSAAGTAPKMFEFLDRDDLVSQTMTAFVSTTANCARCHDHKFDPISQEDYYALQAVFAGVGKGDVAYDEDTDVAAARARWTALKSAAEMRDEKVLATPENQKLVANWEEKSRGGNVAAWQPLEPDVFLSSDGASLKRLPDGSILSGGPRPEKDTVTVIAATKLATVRAIRLDLLTDDALPLKGPGRMDNGNLHLSEFEVQVFRAGAAQPESVKVGRATADFDQTGWTVAHAIDSNPATAWGIHPNVGVPHHAVFEFTAPLALDSSARVAVTLKQLHGRGHLIGRFRLSATDATAEKTMALPADALAALSTPRDKRPREQQILLASAVLSRIAEGEIQRLPPPVKVYAAAARAENERGVIEFKQPNEIRVLRRGDLNKPGDRVAPGSMSAIDVLEARFKAAADKNEGARRAALADWIVHHDNPLTWRSIANRVWQHHFGRGICDTPSDFGRMGGEPSHPELLDWLAASLRDGGGALKPLHRLICTSAAYRQCSTHREDAALIDPDNRLLWRMNRQRLDADSFRDAVIAASGRLDLKMGGPGVSHFKTSPGPQLTPSLDYTNFDWDQPGVSRRSIYRVVWRGIPDPLLDVLDFPDAALLTPSRGFSASPLQALVLLNNEFVLHHSRRLADRRKTLDAVFQQTLMRGPTAREAADFDALAQKHGLAAVCRVLLNSNEFLFVE